MGDGPPPARRRSSSRSPAGAETPVWTDASAERPCPVCGAERGCGVIEGGEFARCTHTTSQWPVLGDGWLHRLAERPAVTGPIRQAPRPAVSVVPVDPPADESAEHAVTRRTGTLRGLAVERG